MVAITANGLYGDRARSLFGMNMPANNGSATSSTSAQSILEKTFGSIAKMAGESSSSNKDIIKLLSKQVELLTSLKKKDGGLSLSDLLIAKYLGKFASAAAAGIGGAAAGIGTLAGGVARTIKGGVGKAFNTLKVGMLGGVNSVFSAVNNGVTSFFKPIVSGIRSITGAFTLGNASKLVSGMANALPKAMSIIGKGMGKLLWPITALMGIFDGFNGFGNADAILGRKATFIEKIRTGLAQVVNGFFLGIPDWLSEKAGFKNFAVLNDKIAETSRQFQDKLFANVTEGFTNFSKTVSDGFSRFKDKLSELGDWARNLLGLGPTATPEQIKNIRAAGSKVGAVIGQQIANNKSTAVDVKGLMGADRLDKIQENLNAQQPLTQTTPVAKAAITTTTAAVTAIAEVEKKASDAIEDNTKKSKSLLEKLVGEDVAKLMGGALEGLNKAGESLTADYMKSMKDLAGASASYLAGTPTNSGINAGGTPGIPGNFRGRGGSAGGAGATGSWTGGTVGATGGTGGTLGALVAGAESAAAGGYNAYNKGTAGGRIIGADKKLDLENMPISEIMRRQSLPHGDPDRLFAVGKYQTIPDTLKGAVAKLGLDTSKTLDKDTQERIFRDYLVGDKRPQIRDFITGKSDNKNAAIEALSNEFASFGGVNGYGKYGSGNKVSVGPQQSAATLDAMRSKYAEGIKNGLSANEAYAQAFGAAGTKSISQVVGNGMIPVKQSDGSTKMVNPNDPTGAKGQAFGGGTTNTATTQMAQVLQGQGQVPGGINRFTAFNDNYHAGSRSKHAAGLAMDFTLNDPAKSAEAAEFLRSQYRKAGLSDEQFKVFDEYKNPSGRATAGHIHGQFADAVAAGVYSKFASENPEALKAQGINKLTDEEKYKSSPFGNTPEAIARRKTIAGIQALEGGKLTPGIDSLPDVSKSIGEAVGKAVTEKVEAPKTPEFVPTPAAPLGGTTPQAAGSAVTGNPTGASRSPANSASQPNLRDVPSLDELSMLLPNSTMMA